MVGTQTDILVNGHGITGTGELRGSGRGETEEVIAFRTEGTPGFPAGKAVSKFPRDIGTCSRYLWEKGTEDRK